MQLLSAAQMQLQVNIWAGGQEADMITVSLPVASKALQGEDKVLCHGRVPSTAAAHTVADIALVQLLSEYLIKS